MEKKYGQKRFEVFVEKIYFPEESYRGRVRLGSSIWEVWFVLATDRISAAKKVWEAHGRRLLAAMKPQGQTRFPARVSLSAGVRGSITGAAGRLNPIRVWEGWHLGTEPVDDGRGGVK